jgi:long-chain acyl-CoA synthetase
MVVRNEAAVRGGIATRGYAANPAELPEGTLVELFLRAVHGQNPRAQLRRTDQGWKPISHGEILTNVQHITAALRAWGLERGDRVGLLAENRPEWAWTDYAALSAGLLTVPLYPTLPAQQLGFIMRHAALRVVFVSTRAQLDKILEIRSELPALERIVLFDQGGPDHASVTSLQEVLNFGRAQNIGEAEFLAEAERARPDDIATLIYTSGTTGEPKGVMLTHNNLYANTVASVRHVLTTSADDLSLSFLPLSHVLQRMFDYTMFGANTPIAYVDVIEQAATAMRELQPTIAVAVPRLYEKIYAKVLAATGVKRRIVLWARHVALAWAERKLAGAEIPGGLKLQHALADRLVYAPLRDRLGGRIRFFVSGGAPLSPQIAHFFYGAGVIIVEGYGLTETSPVTNVNQPDTLRIGTVGQPIPGTEIGIAEDGEILVRGPQVMKGYFKNDEATRAAIDAEGWFHTGDIGTLDEDGFLRITDRKKDLLVTAGGKNVAPQPIQNAAKTSRFVAEALLIGDRRPYTILLIVPNFDSLEAWARQEGLTWSGREALVKDVRVRAKLEAEVSQRMSQFARYEQPKKVLVLPREFSLERGEITPKLSVKRRVVEQAFADRIEALYAEPAPPDHDERH